MAVMSRYYKELVEAAAEVGSVVDLEEEDQVLKQWNRHQVME